MRVCMLLVLLLSIQVAPSHAQDKSVKPGINDHFKDPNVKDFLGKFEVESREIYSQRDKIIAACKLKEGMLVADIGAGTGLFTRLMAKKLGNSGKVYAVDIAPKFLKHIEESCKKDKLDNVKTVRCSDVSCNLEAASVDLVFICDTYHHFEFPHRTLATIHKALKPGGRIVLIDFHRIPGKSRDWTLNHVRAGQEVFSKEITTAGFKLVGEDKTLGLKENYFLTFERITSTPKKSEK